LLPGLDVRNALHQLSLKPGFAVLIILLLGIGIAANTAVFSVVYGVLLHPLPYPDPGRIAFLWAAIPKKQIQTDWTSWPTLQDWRAQTRSFTGVAGILRIDSATLTGLDEPVKLKAGRASANLFPLLGVSPLLGRTYTAEEEQRREALVVVSFRLWRDRFNSSAGVIGRQLEIDHKTAKIIGVMPETFSFPEKDTQLWLPLTFVPNWSAFLVARQADAFHGVARLRPGVSLHQAQAEMDLIANRLAGLHPETERGKGIAIVPLARQIADSRIRLQLWLLFAAVACVLLIGCSNVANLLLAHGSIRKREFAVRTALGATRMRLVKQLLVESTVLALLAGILGMVLAGYGIKALVAFAPAVIPRVDEIRISLPVLLFGFGISLLTGILFGLVPAWQLSFSDPNDALKQAPRTQAGALAGNRTRSIMVAGEFALAVVLLTGAGLLVRSLLSLENISLGFRSDHLMIASIELPEWRTRSSSRPATFFEQAIEKIRALPGIEGAGAVTGFFDNYVPNTQVIVEGQPAAAGQSAPSSFAVASDDFFRVAGVPLLRGRYFASQDTAQTTSVALINQTMARQFWPNDDPIGKRFRYGSPGAMEPEWLTVVGVVGDTHPYGPESQTIAVFFRPHRQTPWVGSMDLVIRSDTDFAGIAVAVRSAVRSVDASVPRFEITSAGQRLSQLSAPRRLETWLLGIFSAVALVLAAAGIYGLLYYLVAHRTQEIGIRVALGAAPSDVVRLIMGQGLKAAAFGIAFGLAASLALTRLMNHLLFGVSPADPLTFTAAAAILFLVAMCASYLPARRAMRLDALLLLRDQ
jgi:predicted permease